jgi:hypothetical protein
MMCVPTAYGSIYFIEYKEFKKIYQTVTCMISDFHFYTIATWENKVLCKSLKSHRKTKFYHSIFRLT